VPPGTPARAAPTRARPAARPGSASPSIYRQIAADADHAAEAQAVPEVVPWQRRADPGPAPGHEPEPVGHTAAIVAARA
jgi:hypothetical protein